MKYKHLTIEDREKIQELLWQKKSPGHIATMIGRHRSTVLREIERNKPPEKNRYTPRLAEERAHEYRTHRGRKDRLKNETVRTYIVSHLKIGWSPEQIAGRMKKDKIGSISHEAIYQFIYAQVHRDGRGYLRPGHEDLRMFLRRKKKRRTHTGMRRSHRIWKDKGFSIDLRPMVVEQKKRIGDFEGDTVESRDHKPGVNTLLERKSGMFFVTKMTDKSSYAHCSCNRETHAGDTHTSQTHPDARQRTREQELDSA
jgi:IS30 family transposase